LVSRPGRPPLMIRWCEHNRRSDGARGTQRRPCPLARGTRCVAGPGRGGSRPVSSHAPHELSCPRGCRKAHPGGHAGDGGREAAEGAAHLSGCEAAADTSMATYTGHWPSDGGHSGSSGRSIRRSFRLVTTSSTLPQGRPCGRPPAAVGLAPAATRQQPGKPASPSSHREGSIPAESSTSTCGL
jgi:hypothetical protein